MKYEEKWEILEEGFGEGGQGKVHLVAEGLSASPYRDLKEVLRKLGSGWAPDSGSTNDPYAHVKEFLELVRSDINTRNTRRLGALKVLHKPKDARNAEDALARHKNEIEAMAKISHPNILKIYDSNVEEGWYVSEYHARGAVSKEQPFKGKLRETLTAFLRLVDGVAKLHVADIVHRDIKPDNLFVADDGRLVLGDFGIVYFDDKEHTRLSGTFENVGSRDFMPGWAYSHRVDEVTPTFDVFSLGKTLWCLLSGKPKFHLWYFDEGRNNLVQQFPEEPFMRKVNDLLSKCVVERERDCLPNASALRSEVSKLLNNVVAERQEIGDSIRRQCQVCGLGEYHTVLNGPIPILSPHVGRTYRYFECAHCGHVQVFGIPEEGRAAWKSK